MDVPLGQLRVLLDRLLGHPVQGLDALSRYFPGVSGCHAVYAFDFMVSGMFISLYHGISEEQRGRAARLARGAHNPKVGSSNLPHWFS